MSLFLVQMGSIGGPKDDLFYEEYAKIAGVPPDEIRRRYASRVDKQPAQQAAFLQFCKENAGSFLFFIVTPETWCLWNLFNRQYDLQKHVVWEKGPIKNHTYPHRSPRLWVKIVKIPETGVFSA